MGALLSANRLREGLAGLIADRWRVLAPSERDGVLVYAEIDDPQEMAWPAEMPLGSLKEHLLREGAQDSPATLVLGCRPCEAKALSILGARSREEDAGEEYAALRATTTVVSFACTTSDANCFCTSVGGGPASAEGSDVQMHQLQDGVLWAEPHSVSGRAFLSLLGVQPADAAPALRVPTVPVRFELRFAQRWLAEHADVDSWPQIGSQCLGCGACRLQCPTCLCSDGRHRLNWCCAGGCPHRGCCSLSLLTPDRDGETPRATSTRWRQWVLHKFVHVARAADRVSCVGCGRCSRACGANIHLARVMGTIDRVARQSGRACEVLVPLRETALKGGLDRADR
ncbi:4Fe-4S dicluster domain-containing protein [bacterium]|nr:4Fe-4S dicluster domain-containing protein [bacterium]